MTATISTQRSCVCIPPGEGELIRIFDEEMVVKLAGSDTDGAYALILGSVAPGGGPPLHAHPGNETLYVLSGEFDFTLRGPDGATTVRCGPGAVAHAPGGSPHRFENVSPTRSALLVVGTPDAVEFLRELGAAFPPGAEPDMEKMLAIHEKYRVETFHGEAGSRPEPAKDGATSERARMLAWRFEQAHATLMSAVESCSPERWSTVNPQSGLSVADEARLAAERTTRLLAAIEVVATGLSHAATARPIGEQRVGAGRAETLAAVRSGGEAAHQLYRALTAEQLERVRTFLDGAAPVTVAQAIEDLAIADTISRAARVRAMTAS